MKEIVLILDTSCTLNFTLNFKTNSVFLFCLPLQGQSRHGGLYLSFKSLEA